MIINDLRDLVSSGLFLLAYNGKIWVQQNMTKWEVGEMLETRGVPKHNIVAGFLPPELREYSKYAVA